MTRPALATATKTFTDPLQPEQPITLSLRVDDSFPSTLAYQSLANTWTEQFLTGTEDSPPNPAAIPNFGGAPVPLTEQLLTSIAFLQTFEVPEAGDEKYDLIDWLALSVNAPTAFAQIVVWGKEQQTKAEDVSKNLSGVSMERSSEPPSITTSRTPNSPPEPTRISQAFTPAPDELPTT